jgi:hypothetical protein
VLAGDAQRFNRALRRPQIDNECLQSWFREIAQIISREKLLNLSAWES